MTRSLAAVSSITEIEEAVAAIRRRCDERCHQVLAVYRQVHAFAYDAGGSSGMRGGADTSPTESTALAGATERDVGLLIRQGARESLVMMGRHLELATGDPQLDRAITAGLGAIRVVQRSGDVARSQTWSVEQAEDVSEEYAIRKRRGQAHARSVGA